MPSAFKLSIVVPTLNEQSCIAHTLGGLQARRESVEIIVADGGSHDDTVAIATPLCDHVVHAPRGRAAQMNAGAAVASGAVLLFLHADTVLSESALESLLAVLKANKADVWGRFDVRISGTHWMLPVIAWFMNTRSRLTQIATGDQAIFVTRSLFQVQGGFVNAPLMEDIDLSARLRRAQRVGYVPLHTQVQTSGRRWESHGVFRTIGLMWSLRYAYWRGVPAEQLHARYYRPRQS